MNLIAHRWRRCLLGTNEDVYRLRTIKLTTPIMESLPVDEIDRDLKRTFPLDEFFTKHTDEIRNVLLWYAWTNPSVGYCQCFSFIAFIMFKVFYENDPPHAMIDNTEMHLLRLLASGHWNSLQRLSIETNAMPAAPGRGFWSTADWALKMVIISKGSWSWSP